MDEEKFKQGLVSLYQGEILGEVLFDQMLYLFEESDAQFKIFVLMQLETETKARLRPIMMHLGLDFREQKEFREIGMQMAEAMKGKSWLEVMNIIIDAVKPAVEQYKAIASIAPQKYLQLAESMVIHEQSIVDFAELEIAGEHSKSIDVIIQQLHNKPLSAQ
ncbi:hypothetical protein RGQ13_07525 [Thalassotalea psychrophila]|uniref:Uncharacterized protein n=1 Tax=Thalassotalea psychrophila TaxID=3065647 RepID=A0ABY9TY95_9GAMM|nr:hypothetical protein RGQ13_07525 [Colwelliaceae bacterium SQ149]